MRDELLRHPWFSKLSVLLCLLTAHASLSLGAGDLLRSGADSATCGGFAVPVKPAAAQITDRGDLGLDTGKTRTGLSTSFVLSASIAGHAPFSTNLLSEAGQPGRPQSDLLRVRLGRAPPAISLQ